MDSNKQCTIFRKCLLRNTLIYYFIFLDSHSSQQGQENSNTCQNATEPYCNFRSYLQFHNFIPFLYSHSSQQGQENSNTSQNATEPDDLDDDLDEDLDDDEDVMKLRRNQSTAVILLGKDKVEKI